MDFIDAKANDFLDQCRVLADLLIFQSGKEVEPYWNEAARTVLTAFIAFVCACETNPEKRNLDTVRDLLSSRSSYAKALEIMQQVKSHGGGDPASRPHADLARRSGAWQRPEQCPASYGIFGFTSNCT